MALQPGMRLGVYEVHSAIGTGGMGEVYRARDTRLQRDVALKILPEAFSSDSERLARFDREAQVLASLNHPHIAAIHGLEESGGVRALVLELVEGDTLADLIARRAGPSGPANSSGLSLDEVLSIARQIADALEAAHEQGIVHRDLKPSNVKVRPDGTVKVLDFGLAKLVGEGDARSVRQPDLTLSPTITTPAMTQVGVIMGTAAYMSPEQAKGREADKRSDVWAFGALLYEMLTGKRAFDGDDMSDTLASVLKIDPDWSRLPADTPPALRTLIQRCLARDRRERVSDIAAAKFVLSELSDIGTSQTLTTAAATSDIPSRPRLLVALVATALLTTAIVGAAVFALRPQPTTPVVGRFSFTLPDGQLFSGTVAQSVAISPDGTQIAYTADARVFLRSIGDLEPHEIPGTRFTESIGLGVTTPMFSPDGKSIAYLGVAGTGTGATVRTLMRIPIVGGTATPLARLDRAGSGSWIRDGILISIPDGIVRVPANGGSPERIVTVGADEEAQTPRMLPDGRTVIFTLAKRTGDDRWGRAKIVAQSLESGTREELLDGNDARYVETGHLVYVIGGTMFAVRFDPKTLRVSGDRVPIVVGVRRALSGQSPNAHFAFSDAGTLVYRPGPASVSTGTRGMVLADGRSDPQPLRVTEGFYAHPRVSRDGKRLTVAKNDGDSSDIWIYELSGTSEIRKLTFDGKSRFPIWSSDGRYVTFQSASEGDDGIWRVPADGGSPERLTKPSGDEAHIPESWSPDGRRLLFTAVKGTRHSLWMLEDSKTEPVGKIESQEPFGATFSPNGQWIAYAFADDRGGGFSPNRGVYIEPFPPTGLKVQAPKLALDYHPVWAPDNKSIFYLPGASRSVYSVPVTVTTQPSVVFGKPTEMPRGFSPGLLSTEARGYDLLPDGRFISVVPTAGDPSGGVGNEIRVVTNWFEELKRLVP
jgi:eukaryotic-like serine/threonine-protein kinase